MTATDFICIVWRPGGGGGGGGGRDDCYRLYMYRMAKGW